MKFYVYIPNSLTTWQGVRDGTGFSLLLAEYWLLGCWFYYRNYDLCSHSNLFTQNKPKNNQRKLKLCPFKNELAHSFLWKYSSSLINGSFCNVRLDIAQSLCFLVFFINYGKNRVTFSVMIYRPVYNCKKMWLLKICVFIVLEMYKNRHCE
jgi:hypothetical protein